MKVQSAVIKIVHWTSKVLKDGTSPILLQVSFYGTTRLSTHISCLPKDWNDRSECLKKTYPNFAIANKIIQDLKNRAIGIKLEYEASGIEYTSSMIIDQLKPKEHNANKLEYKTIMENLIAERHLRSATSNMYQSVYNTLTDFFGKGDFLITEITNDALINFAKMIEEKTKCSNTVLAYVSKIVSVLNFANDNEIVSHFPKKGNAWVNSNFKKTVSHKALTEAEFNKVLDYFGKMDKVGLFSRTSKEFAVAFAICSYTLFGLAPCDCAKLKVDCFETVTVQGCECWKVSTKRSKTNQPLTIIVIKESYGGSILGKYIESANERNGYIFPILGNHSYDTERKESKIINWVEGVINSKLKEMALETGIKPFTLYSMRHSFASHKLKEGASLSVIATALGRSVNNIGCYIQNLEQDSDLLKIAAF